MSSTTIPNWILLNSMLVDEEGNLRDTSIDKKATRAYFTEYVNENMMFFHDLEEKLSYLVKEGYYQKSFLKQYAFDDIKRVYQTAYAIKFRFESFMSAHKMYEDYMLKTYNKSRLLERYEDRMAIVALYHADGDVSLAIRMVERLVRQGFTPATPTLLNSGRARGGEQVSCFLLSCGDSLNDIARILEQCMQLSKIGGGVSINMTDIRSRGEEIDGTANAAKGIIPFAKLFDNAARAVDQKGQRLGAFAIYYNIFGADVEELLASKSVNADEDSRLVTLSIGLVVPNKFYELVQKDADMYVFYPYTVKKAFGKPFSEIVVEMDTYYDQLVAHPDVRKRKMRARDLFEEITISLGESGYPFVMNVDNVNDVNPLADKVHFSNLCTEILQPSTVSEYADYDKREEDVIGMDISCNLASLNIKNTMRDKALEEDVELAMTIMNSVSDKTALDFAPGVAKANKLNRSVGLGAMNLHGYLASQYISYGSDEAIEFVDVFFAAVNFYSLRFSMEKSKRTGKRFYRFEQSKYADGSYFEKHGEVLPASPKVTQLFEGVKLPTQADWDQLKVDVMTYGLYNSNRLAIAPTGSVSYANNATPSVSCVKKLIEERTYGKSKTYFPMPEVNKYSFMYETAYEADKYKLIDMIATMQKHVDQGISFELNIPSTMTSRELQKLYFYAHHVGLKTVYYTRTKKVDITGRTTETGGEDCVSCAV